MRPRLFWPHSSRDSTVCRDSSGWSAGQNRHWVTFPTASSPSRTIAGLRSFPEKVILIAGGYDKHIPYDVLGPEICAHVKKLYLGGATGQKIREAVERCPEYDPKALEIVDCGSFEPAVRAAAAASSSDT